jgi:hypothetical protein
VKDPNSGLPKNVLIAWCGGGVPERTKGYFTSHTAAVGKVLHGYHVQITARTDSDIAPETIVQKVSDASGAKYTAGGSAPMKSAVPPPIAKKPVFTPTAISGATGSFNPLVAARAQRQTRTDDDGWGADAPQVTRTEIQKVESAYKPTKVNMAELLKNRDESSSGNGVGGQSNRPEEVVRGGYQPIGKVDIAALRAQAKNASDDRPTTVKGAYEPIGKVDIAAIRAKAQRPVEAATDEGESKSLADRSAAFTQSERLTELPKPKVAKKFGGSSFTGTKAPTPGGMGFGGPSVPSSAPVGAASRTFADQGGKTPAQLWAEKKGKQGGAVASAVSPPVTSPVTAQKSGSEWKSGYAGKSWATVQTANYGRGLESQKTGGTDQSAQDHAEVQSPPSPGGGVSALKDRFKGAAPMGNTAPSSRSVPAEAEPAAPPPPMGTRPSGGFALPGLPSRPAPAEEEEEEEEEAEAQPPVPSRNYEERDESPVRIAMPVARGPEPDVEPPAERLPARPVPIPDEVPEPEEVAEEEVAHDAGAAPEAEAPSGGGQRALIKYDYEKSDNDEIALREGEYLTDVEMMNEDWWMGTNADGERGLFPSAFVELAQDDADPSGGHGAAAPSAPANASGAAPAAAGGEHGNTATALYDHEAAEPNGKDHPC